MLRHFRNLPSLDWVQGNLLRGIDKKTVRRYHTRAIITRGLYTFYSRFEVHLGTVTFGLMYG